MEDFPTAYAFESVHRVRQVRSGNEFASQTLTNLRHCTAMSGFMACSTGNRADVYSAGRLSSAWLDGSIDRTVVAWMNQDHSSDGANTASNEIWISVGHVDNDTLSIPHKTGFRTAVPPSVVCMEDFYTIYDCVLLYVPIDDLSLQLRARRFYVTQSSNNYSVTFESGSGHLLPAAARTAEPFATWFISSNDTFYLAFRNLASGQQISVYSSLYGSSWSLVTSSLSDALTGPSAATTWRGTNNLLVYPN
jgi:hypothetical protein